MKAKKTVNKKAAKRKGIVVSDKMDKTVIVAAENYKTHFKYLKKYRFTKRYKVHDQENKYKIGDTVEFIECGPISKGKKFKVL